MAWFLAAEALIIGATIGGVLAARAEGIHGWIHPKVRAGGQDGV